MKYERNVKPQNRVFVNRTLNLNNIKLVGFDMDYTLVSYNVPVFEEAAYKIVLNKLVNNLGYPDEILKLEFNPDFIIRGLVIDIERGNLIKVNRYGYVKKCSHGTRFMSMEEQKKIYANSSIDWADPRYYIIHTLFSLAEGCLFAQLVDFFEREKKVANLPQVFREIRASMDDAHQEGSLKGMVIENPEKFIFQKPRLIESLKNFKLNGKKLALITNSDYEYSKQVMDFCFKPFLDETWQDFFDIVIVAANKPAFFQHPQKFLKVDRNSGLLSNFFEPVRCGQIYQAGNAKTLERDLKLLPSEILYVGDHIYVDVVTLKETVGWRTGLVVTELEKEVPILEKNLEISKQLFLKMKEKEDLENEFFAIKEELRGVSHENRDKKSEKRRDELRHKINTLEEGISGLIDREQKDFNPCWGEVMRSGNEESRFATLVERFACIYMACVSNLSHYSAFKYFRPRRRYLAHDPNPFETPEAFHEDDG